MAKCKMCGKQIHVPRGWSIGPAVRRHYWVQHPDRMQQDKSKPTRNNSPQSEEEVVANDSTPTTPPLNLAEEAIAGEPIGSPSQRGRCATTCASDCCLQERA